MSMPASSSGGTWLSGDTIGKTTANIKTNLVVPSATYVPVIGTDTYAGQLYIDPTTGIVRVMNAANTVWNVIETSYFTRDPIGFPVTVGATANYVNPNNHSLITFTNTSPARTFSIAPNTPTYTQFRVYIQGLEYVFNSAQTVQITNTEGLWFFYFNAAGTLIASQSYWDLSSVAAVAYVYWDATDSACIYFADERHMMTMDWRTHQYLHNTIGCRYASGLAISGYTIGASGDSNVEIGIANGIVYDEDLEFLITNGTSGTPASTPNFYNMPLTKPATIPVFYQIGNTGVWRKHVTANFYLYPDANPRPYYNLDTAGTWSLASTPSGDFVSYWIFASNDIDNPIISIMGQQVNTTLTNAINNDTYGALSIASTGLPFVEMKLLYQIILQVLNSYGGSTSSRVAQVNDFRTISLVGGVAPSIANFITSVDPAIFEVIAGQLSIGSKIIPAANLGSGVNTAYFLRGDNTWQPVSGGSGIITSVDTTYFTITTGELFFSGTHAQAVGSGDNPAFNSLAIGGGHLAGGLDLTNTGTIEFTGGPILFTTGDVLECNSTITAPAINVIPFIAGEADLTLHNSGGIEWVIRQKAHATSDSLFISKDVSAVFTDYLSIDTSGNVAVLVGNLAVAGSVTGSQGIITDYLTGAYGAAWGSLPSFPTATNGMMVLLYNTDASESRIYVYSNGAWDFFRKSVGYWYVYISTDPNGGSISPVGAQEVATASSLGVTYTLPATYGSEYKIVEWLLDGSPVGVGATTYNIPAQTTGTIHTLVPVTAINTPPVFFNATGNEATTEMAEQGNIADALLLDLPPTRAETNTITNS